MMRLPSPMPPAEALRKPPEEGNTWWSGMEDLWRIWLEPGAVLRFAVGTLLLLCLRLPFARAAFVPGFVEYQPGFALVPFLGAAWGAAGCWAAVASSLLGDGWMGVHDSVRWPRVLGVFLAARCGQHLLRGGNERISVRILFSDYVRCIPSACIAALCAGAAAGAGQYYPCTYVSTLSLAQHLFFLALFMPLLSYGRRRAEASWRGAWRLLRPHLTTPGPSRPVKVLLWCGAVGGWLATYLTSGWVDGIWPRTLHLIGTVPTGWAPRVAFLFVCMVGTACVWPPATRSAPIRLASPSGGC